MFSLFSSKPPWLAEPLKPPSLFSWVNLRRVSAASKFAVANISLELKCTEPCADQIVRGIVQGTGIVGLTSQQAGLQADIRRHPEGLGNETRRALAYGAWVMAMVNLKRVYARNPLGSQAFFDDLEKIIFALEFSTIIDPANPGAYCTLAYTKCAFGGPDSASESLLHCEKAIEIDQNCAEAWRLKATALTLLEQRAEARECLQRALKLNPLIIVPKQLRDELGV